MKSGLSMHRYGHTRTWEFARAKGERWFAQPPNDVRTLQSALHCTYLHLDRLVLQLLQLQDTARSSWRFRCRFCKVARKKRSLEVDHFHIR